MNRGRHAQTPNGHPWTPATKRRPSSPCRHSFGGPLVRTRAMPFPVPARRPTAVPPVAGGTLPGQIGFPPSPPVPPVDTAPGLVPAFLLAPAIPPSGTRPRNRCLDSATSCANRGDRRAQCTSCLSTAPNTAVLPVGPPNPSSGKRASKATPPAGRKAAMFHLEHLEHRSGLRVRAAHAIPLFGLKLALFTIFAQFSQI